MLHVIHVFSFLAIFSVECESEEDLLELLELIREAVIAGAVYICRMKHRLDAAFEALEFGGWV